MSSDVVLRTENLGKTYSIWPTPMARLQAPILRRLVKLPLLPRRTRERWKGKAADAQRLFHALRGVSISVRRGQSVGIVGRNGSGKSTLLQLIAGTLTPSAGQVEVTGRVGALLELGSGFNPEFTGRENALLSATVLGFDREQLNARFEQILAFAEIGAFIDQPVKTYSSGMMLRLAFAVNIHLEPDILIIDEALSVGDVAFQRKCISRIEQFRRDGGTLLLVSHDPGSVVALCDHAVLLERGEVLLQDKPKLVTSQYYKLAFAPADRYEEVKAEVMSGVVVSAVPQACGSVNGNQFNDEAHSLTSSSTRAFYLPTMISQSVISYPSQGARIEAPRVLDADGNPVNMLVRGERYAYEYTVTFNSLCFRVSFGMAIKTVGGIELGASGSGSEEQLLPVVEPGTCLTIRHEFDCRLLPGVYFLNAGTSGVVGQDRKFLHRLVDAYLFRVQDEPGLPLLGFVDFGGTVAVFDQAGHEITNRRLPVASV
ncbi:MAG: ABC transporter ATP-binding protein [Verrucomicrobia bacterium]|nr:ABC transporter ATP-binding protein [Verrucomicrobiota bacterium]MBV9658308.1 ABC transporter ATP-binding protein [Verrucomicrobiota bacterium]